MAEHQSVSHDCSRTGCKNKATCIPVLVVPAHPISGTKYEGVRSILWLPLCDHHFSAANVREFLSEEVIAGMRTSIDQEFRNQGAIADWAKAAVQRLGKNAQEFKTYESIYVNIAKGTPADIAVKDQLGKAN